MIIVKEDKSYLSSLDIAAIENGLAGMSIHSLKFNNHLTEDQKQRNLEESKILTREQWGARCEQKGREVGNKLEYIMNTLADVYTIYQYKNRNVSYSKDDWDLFFYSNKGWNGSDYMDHATLSPNSSRMIEQQITDINNVLDLIKTMDIKGIEVSIKYTAIYNEEKVNEVVKEYCEKMHDQFIEYGCYVGKIVEFNGRYVFRKKGAKKNAYEINNNSVLKNVLAI